MSEPGAPSAKLDEKARRVRSLLSSYYGTAQSQGGEATGGSKSDKQQPGQTRVASIDSAAFDVKPFMNALVKGAVLGDDLRKRLKSEIRWCPFGVSETL